MSQSRYCSSQNKKVLRRVSRKQSTWFLPVTHRNTKRIYCKWREKRIPVVFLLCWGWRWIGMARNFPWAQNANWTYIRRSEDVSRLMCIQFTSCVQGVGNGSFKVCFELFTNNGKFGCRIKVFTDLSSWLFLTSFPTGGLRRCGAEMGRGQERVDSCKHFIWCWEWDTKTFPFPKYEKPCYMQVKPSLHIHARNPVQVEKNEINNNSKRSKISFNCR